MAQVTAQDRERACRFHCKGRNMEEGCLIRETGDYCADVHLMTQFGADERERCLEEVEHKLMLKAAVEHTHGGCISLAKLTTVEVSAAKGYGLAEGVELVRSLKSPSQPGEGGS